VAISPAQMARMARECERVRYVKVEAPPTPAKVSEVRAAAGDMLTIFGGLNGHFLLEELRRGAQGTMPGSDMVDMFVRVWNSYRAGKLDEARAEFNRHLPLIRYELQPGLGVAVMKQNLKAAGVIRSAFVRPPTRSLDPAGLEELEQLRHGLKRGALARTRQAT
jgi:4-hydroxy-tetrahydrodipicolinate synthase